MDRGEASWQARLLALFDLGAPHRSPRAAWWCIAGVLAIYLAGFAVYYPRAITVADEGNYVRQARLFAAGQTVQSKIDPFTGDVFEPRTTKYPAGTALILLPWVYAGGWRAGFAASALCLVLGVLFTAAWLREERRSPAWALLILGYPAALVLGRVAMSELPSLAAVALASWLFWRGTRGSAGAWLGAGFVAGASLLLRETNALLLAGFFVGALLRRERRVWALVVGGVLGAGLRPLAGWIAYGDPFHYKSVSAFGLEYVLSNLPLYALGLLVFVPGGLVAALAYRGDRRPEVVGTVAGFVLFYLFYSYGGSESSGAKGLVLGQRFFVPLLPLLAFAMAESLPRVWQRAAASRAAPHRWLRALAPGILGVWLLGVAGACFAVHVVMDRFAETQVQMRDAIYGHTPDKSLLITNWKATGKYIDLLYGARLPLDRAQLTAKHVDFLRRRHRDVHLVLLDRSDSPFWQRDSEANAAFVAALRPRPELVLDERYSPTDRLRIWRIPSR